MPYRVLIEGGRTRNMYPTILSYGGGADSTALAIGLCQRGEIPDSIVFAAVGDFRSFPEGGDIRDLARIGIEYGDEMPETYEALVKVDDWLRDHGMPGITVITYLHLSDRYAGLYENCIANHTLPGISFGSPNCSQKHKGQGIDWWVRANYPWAFRVRRLIGYDAAPKDGKCVTKITFKMKKTGSATEKADWIYQLVDWQMTRGDCIAPARRRSASCRPNRRVSSVRRVPWKTSSTWPSGTRTGRVSASKWKRRPFPGSRTRGAAFPARHA